MHDTCITCGSPTVGLMHCPSCIKMMIDRTNRNIYQVHSCQRCGRSTHIGMMICPECSDITGKDTSTVWHECEQDWTGYSCQCQQYPDATVVWGCLNMHITTKRLCLEHAREMWQSAAKSELFCVTCESTCAEAVFHDGHETHTLSLPSADHDTFTVKG